MTIGFSLVELLVVIAVIVILLALLLPAIGMARANSRAKKCASNQVQIFDAWTRANSRQRVRGADWPTRLAGYMEGSTDTLFCPDDPTRSNPSSYGVNAHAYKFLAQDTGRIVLLDYNQTDALVVGRTVAELNDWNVLKAPRHFQSQNVMFADGHVGVYEPRKIDPRFCDYYDRYWRPFADSNVNLSNCVYSGDSWPSIASGTTGGNASSAHGATTITAGASNSSSSGSSSSSSTTTSTTTGGATTGGVAPEPPMEPCELATFNDDLLLLYAFDDPLDPFMDTGPNAYHGTPTGTILYTTEQDRGGVVQFTNGSYVTIPKQALACLDKEVTISVWLFGTFADPANGYPHLLYGAYWADNHTRLASNIMYNYWWGSVHNATWDGSGSGYEDRVNFVPSQSNVSGSWRHWVFVKNSNSGEMRTYVSGTPYASGTKFRTVAGPWETFYLGIGCGPTCAADANYQGRINDFRVYKRAFSAGEILSLGSESPDDASARLHADAGPPVSFATPTNSGNLAGRAWGGHATPTVTWSKVSGPGTVTFGNATAASTTVTCDTPGTYVLRLTASDGTNTATSDVTVSYFSDNKVQYVRIRTPGANYLTMAEVQVFVGGVNVATAGSATQSSNVVDHPFFYASKAIDGSPAVGAAAPSPFQNLTPSYSCSYTSNSGPQWWVLNLGSKQTISQIRIWNRCDQYGDALSNAIVETFPDSPLALPSQTPTWSTQLGVTANCGVYDLTP